MATIKRIISDKNSFNNIFNRQMLISVSWIC